MANAFNINSTIWSINAFSEKKNEKQEGNKTCTKSPKRKYLPFMQVVVFLTENGKNVQKKLVWIGWKHVKSTTCYSEKSLLKNNSQRQKLFSSSYQRTQPLLKFLSNTCLRAEFSAEPLTKMNNIFVAWCEVQSKQKSFLSLWSYKVCNIFHFASLSWSYIEMWS